MSEMFDVILYGPTGVTGREVARYLHQRAPELGLRWAVAGRDRSRIDAALARVEAEPDGILLADSADPDSIRTMVEAAAVVANLVGPYARYGEPVHAACAASGTHQVDLTGELDWVREMIDRHGDVAVESGACVVPTAGFEALPFDLGAALAAETAHAHSGSPVVEVDIAVSMLASGRGGAISGGTFQSGMLALQRGDSAAFTDAHVLDPPGWRGSGGYTLWPRRHPTTGDWLAPMVPSPYLNPPVVHRSAALRRSEGDGTFALEFRYREGMSSNGFLPEPAAPVLAPVVATSLAGFAAGFGLLGRAPAALRGPVAEFGIKRGPQPGDGPDPDSLDDWAYRLDIRATCADGTTADATVEADGHPGYKSTATMVGEAALLLADPSANRPDRAGYLTPSTALGTAELDRFASAGARFAA